MTTRDSRSRKPTVTPAPGAPVPPPSRPRLDALAQPTRNETPRRAGRGAKARTGKTRARVGR